MTDARTPHEGHVRETGYGPCAWLPHMRTIDQLAEDLLDFGLNYTPGSAQNRLQRLGILAAHKFIKLSSGYGQVGYHDPLACWVVVTAKESGVPPREQAAAFRHAHRSASRAVWRDFGGREESVPEDVRCEWSWRVLSTAFHLFISDPLVGLRPYRIAQLLESGLDSKTMDSPECLRSTLAVYASSLNDSFIRSRLSAGGGQISGREALVLDSLDSFGVLVASERRLGQGPYVAKERHAESERPIDHE